MGESGYFMTGLGICTAITLGILLIIHRRFQVMMNDLCEGEARGRFWSLAVEAWLFLFSIGAALKWNPDGLTDRQLFLGSINQVRSGLNGMSTAIILFSAGLIVFVLIRKFRVHEDGAGKEAA